MKKKKLTKLGKIVVTVLVAALATGTACILAPNLKGRSAAAVQQTAAASSSASASPVPVESSGTDTKEHDYATCKSLNSDFIGELKFESGLVDQNVVQSTDNDKYLNLSWDLKKDTQGAAFLDYRNNLTDQNLIIYGHYVYYDATKMFTPLEQLRDQKNYEANKYIDLLLADNETRRYQITDVFDYVMDNESMEYYFTQYGADYFKEYYDAVKKADFYDTGESLTMDDHWISLQTCVRDHDELRQIVLAKQIS